MLPYFEVEFLYFYELGIWTVFVYGMKGNWQNVNHVITVWYRIVYVLYFLFQFYWIQIIIIVTTTDLLVM
jgi:hypothetical protein